ncbi:hypothetical protein J2T32_002294 [Kerstersia gyiorum]|nr:hypothetical protein [Kerstersia gyiorum]MCP1637456.1 hypothetical protein [Kerstersia gyiorum]MCP1671606.1 hypothetical protein [Kerstersia gyiorum]MCP1679500.1 hypothetical protein [Kerstersia gyiorum]MCP1683120.1 hypothetical protein [Kerstersia gyiorum]
MVTSSNKRQLSPRLAWWVHICKRERWHSPIVSTLLIPHA